MISDKCPACMYVLVGMPVCVCTCAILSGYREKYGSTSMSFSTWLIWSMGFPCRSAGEESPCTVRDLGFIPEAAKIRWRREWLPLPVFLPGESPWTKEAGGLRSMVSQRVRHDRATNTH